MDSEWASQYNLTSLSCPSVPSSCMHFMFPHSCLLPLALQHSSFYISFTSSFFTNVLPLSSLRLFCPPLTFFTVLWYNFLLSHFKFQRFIRMIAKLSKKCKNPWIHEKFSSFKFFFRITTKFTL